MMTRIPIVLFLTLFLSGQDNFLPEKDMQFMKNLTAEVIDSSRIFAGENFQGDIASFGPNNSGITLIRPGGRNCYPSFWIRDYAMSIESGFISLKEQKDILEYTSARQADSTWITNAGSIVPLGSIPDHIRVSDGLPVYFPGTYSFEMQGSPMWRLPPYCDQYFYIHMAWNYVKQSGDKEILKKAIGGKDLLSRLELAFRSVPSDQETPLVKIDTVYQTCDFGFRDIVTMSGNVCFGSILKFRAANQMAELYKLSGRSSESEEYSSIGKSISELLPEVFMDKRGFMLASTAKSNQPDVWATAFAVYTNALKEPFRSKACKALSKAYQDGTMTCEGQVRHVLTSDDFSETTAWEIAASQVNRYQNGAYWGTPSGWVCYALAQEDIRMAAKMAGEYIDHLRKTDFRVDPEINGGPYECIYPKDNYSQNPVYMTSVSVPYAAFLRIVKEL